MITYFDFKIILDIDYRADWYYGQFFSQRLGRFLPHTVYNTNSENRANQMTYFDNFIIAVECKTVGTKTKSSPFDRLNRVVFNRSVIMRASVFVVTSWTTVLWTTKRVLDSWRSAITHRFVFFCLPYANTRSIDSPWDVLITIIVDTSLSVDRHGFNAIRNRTHEADGQGRYV